MIIDFHNHLSPPHSPYRLPIEEYLKVMDEHGVERAVILGKDYGLLGDRQAENLSDEEVADFVRTNPDRFIGFTAVHPDREIEINLTRIDRAVNELGLHGIKLNPASGFYPNDQRLYPIYEKASMLGLPIVVHMGIKPPSEGSRLKYCLPVYLDDLIVDFPELTVIVAHGAYPWVDELIAVALYAPNVFVDISTLNQIEEALGYPVLRPVLEKLVKALGSARIVFGSDGIFNIEPIVGAVLHAEFLTENDRRKILEENARRILRL